MSTISVEYTEGRSKWNKQQSPIPGEAEGSKVEEAGQSGSMHLPSPAMRRQEWKNG